MSLVMLLLISTVFSELFLCHEEQTQDEINYKWLARQSVGRQIDPPYGCIERPDVFNYWGMIVCLDMFAVRPTGNPNTCIAQTILNKNTGLSKVDEMYCYTAGLDVFTKCFDEAEIYSGVYVCALRGGPMGPVWNLREGDSLPESNECTRIRQLDRAYDRIDGCVRDRLVNTGLTACVFDVKDRVIQRASCKTTQPDHFWGTCYEPFKITASEVITKIFVCHKHLRNVIDFDALAKYNRNDIVDPVHMSGCDAESNVELDYSAMVDCMSKHKIVATESSNNCIIQVLGDIEREREVVRQVQCLNMEESDFERCYLAAKRTTGVFAYMKSSTDKELKINDVFHYPEMRRWITPGIKTYESMVECLRNAADLSLTRSVVVEIKEKIVVRISEISSVPRDLVTCARQLAIRGLQANNI